MQGKEVITGRQVLCALCTIKRKHASALTSSRTVAAPAAYLSVDGSTDKEERSDWQHMHYGQTYIIATHAVCYHDVTCIIATHMLWKQTSTVVVRQVPYAPLQHQEP